MGKCICSVCGHIGYPVYVHNDDKCEKCLSGQITEVKEYSGSNY